MNSSNETCLVAEQSVNDLGYNIVRVLQTVLGSSVLAQLAAIVLYCKRNPANLHGNLQIILASLMLFYAVFFGSFITIAVRNFYLASTHTDPCECLTPVWLVYVLRMPFYAYIAASPMFHFAIMVERVRATLFVHHYELQQRPQFGTGCVTVVALSTFAFCLYVYCSSVIDPTFSRPMVYFTLTSKYNAVELIYVHFFFLLLVVCISLADYWLIRMNRRVKNSISAMKDYSLSRNYQANENILTMRIIFPLDFSYTVFFTAFNLLSSYVRERRTQIGEIAYMRTYEAIILLLFVHAVLTLAVYQYFLVVRVNAKRMTAKVEPARDQAKKYFQNLNKQWN